MAVDESPSIQTHTAQLLSGPSRGWEESERELVETGLSLPLHHRTVWAGAHSSAQSWFLAVRDAAGRCTCGFAIDVTRSRVLPGHLLLRVERFGPALNDEARVAAVTELARLARRAPVLRVYLDVFSRDCSVRDQVAAVAHALGFRRPASPWTYTQTVVVDLTPDESDILASFNRNARRNIRDIGKQPFAVRPISDVQYAPRMEALMRETVARTGGACTSKDWPAIITFSNAYPTLSRVVGQFRTDGAPETLVAFSCARSHGDYVEDYARASTRVEGRRVSLTHSLVWDLMRWAKANGARWYDFGGITAGHSGGTDPVGGISDFKRSFGGEVVIVGDAWVLEPRPFRASLQKAASRVWLLASGHRRVAQPTVQGADQHLTPRPLRLPLRLDGRLEIERMGGQ